MGPTSADHAPDALLIHWLPGQHGSSCRGLVRKRNPLRWRRIRAAFASRRFRADCGGHLLQLAVPCPKSYQGIKGPWRETPSSTMRATSVMNRAFAASTSSGQPLSSDGRSCGSLAGVAERSGLGRGHHRNIPFSFDDANMRISQTIETPALTLVSKRRDSISVKRARTRGPARFDLKARVGVPLRA
jgi:hypothetical protein